MTVSTDTNASSFTAILQRKENSSFVLSEVPIDVVGIVLVKN